MKLRYLMTLPFYFLLIFTIWESSLFQKVLALTILFIVDVVSYGTGFSGGLKRGK